MVVVHFVTSVLILSILSLAGKNLSWPASENAASKNKTFNCHMLVKPQGDEQDGVEPKPHPMYENMQISAVLQPHLADKDADSSSTDAESQSCLVCTARRINLPEKNVGMLGVEQFTTKQDLHGKILDCDTSGINPGSFTYPDFNGKNIQEFCHVNDVQQLVRHHQEARSQAMAVSSIVPGFITTKSKLFRNPSTGKPEIIFSTHCIVRECDADTELKGSASTSLMKSIIGQSGPKNRNLLQPLVGSPKATPTAMVFPNNAVMSQSSLGGTNIDLLLHSTAPSCGGSTSCIDLDPDQININDVLSLLPDGWDTAIMQPPGVSTCGAMTTETSLAHVAQNKLGTIATATMTSQCSADRTNLHARMLSVNKTPSSPRYLGQRSPRFMAQRSPGMNANAMLTSQLQQTISQAGSLPSGAVGSGLVGLARMMSPKQQGGAVARSMSCSSVSSEEDLSYLFGNSPTGCGSQMGVKAGMMGGETVAMLKHKQQELHQGMCCRGLSRLRELSRQAR
ncbi:hypothetical protein NP493_702g03084 [Ridgeia piscesae]|uniref:Uncharacterized protein n=1 Tax=Ridgeia piscesae TaxID=27915 RepID=A0AAD9KRA0_RIDPI|nr:hypothetical protein NP493_702g03084 [Ridgeia piscesae]